MPCQNIRNTISSLPKNPTESGLIPVNWKRKVSYKNTHKAQYVDINRLFDGLEYLIAHNPLYKESTIDQNFLNRCKDQDPLGYDAFLEQDPELDEINSDDEAFLQIIENENDSLSEDNQSEDEMEKEDKEYNDYAKTDPIRKFQFDYDEHVALTRDDPTAVSDANRITKKSYSFEGNNSANVAPGEGQIPISTLKEERWDIKTYPNLFPDGENGMNANGNVKLTNEQYLRQRLCNIDKRFANDPGYLFSSTWHIENQQLEKNISMAYTHGARKPSDDSSQTYQVKNPYHVLHKIPDSPEFWQAGNCIFNILTWHWNTYDSVPKLCPLGFRKTDYFSELDVLGD